LTERLLYALRTAAENYAVQKKHVGETSARFSSDVACGNFLTSVKLKAFCCLPYSKRAAVQ